MILLLCKTWATFCHCFVHQHGRLITWVKTKNRPRNTWDVGRTLVNLANHSPPACDFQALLVSFQHPACVYYAGQPIENAVFCLTKIKTVFTQAKICYIDLMKRRKNLCMKIQIPLGKLWNARNLKVLSWVLKPPPTLLPWPPHKSQGFTIPWVRRG